MRIGITASEYPPVLGGVGQSVRRISKGLAAAGCEIYVFVLPTDTDNSPVHVDQHQISRDGEVHIIRLQPAKRRSRDSQKSRDVACFEWLCDFCRDHQLDLLHSFYISHTGFITGLTARNCGVPFIASVRGNDLHQNLFDSSQFTYILWTLENADLLTFVSASLEQRARALCGRIGRTRVIWNSVDPSDFLSLGSPDRFTHLIHPIIASAGEFRHKKGIERLLDACTRLEREMTLLLIGDFNWAEREYWQQRIVPNVPQRVHLEVTGAVPHETMLDHFRLADIAVFPAIHEGCPNTMLESMLAGLPVICTRVGAMGDIMEKSHGGIVLDPYTPDSLSNAIALLLDDAELRATLSQDGRCYVLKQLLPENETAAWLECYRRVLED